MSLFLLVNQWRNGFVLREANRTVSNHLYWRWFRSGWLVWISNASQYCQRQRRSTCRVKAPLKWRRVLHVNAISSSFSSLFQWWSDSDQCETNSNGYSEERMRLPLTQSQPNWFSFRSHCGVRYSPSIRVDSCCEQHFSHLDAPWLVVPAGVLWSVIEVVKPKIPSLPILSLA